MKLVEVRIKNFRSLKSCNIKVDDFNIVVGTNDVGKSNILKALNLFFNDETERGNEWNPAVDFTKNWNPRSKRGKTVLIELRFQVPDNFTDSGIVVWKKEYGVVSGVLDKDEITMLKGEFSPRSKVKSTLRKIKFRYVPAIKSDSFFRELLGDMYNTMSNSINNNLQSSIANLSSTLQKSTKSLSSSLFTTLGLESKLSFPSDLTDVFRVLDFDTQIKGSKSISVNYRGDGVKARHIPQILSFIAIQDNAKRAQGSTAVHTIWGYEEPENNLEFLNSYKLADELYDLSLHIQMFITTHSPSFYSKKDSDRVNLFYVSQENDMESQIQSNVSEEELNEKMGTLELVTPFVNEKILEIRRLTSSLDNIKSDKIFSNEKIIVVEGPTDKEYIQLASEALNIKLDTLFKQGDIVFSARGGGYNLVKDFTIAHCLEGKHTGARRLYSLFDGDKDAIKAHSEIKSNKSYENMRKKRLVKTNVIPKIQGSPLISLAKIKAPFAIEHLLPIETWELADKKELLEDNTNLGFIDSNLLLDKSAKDVVLEKLEKDIAKYFVFKKIKTECKKDFVNLVKDELSNKNGEEKKEYFVEFTKLLDDIAEFFDSK